MSFDEMLEDVINDAEVPLTGGTGAIHRSLTVSLANEVKAKSKAKKDEVALAKPLKLKKDPTTPKAKCKAICSKWTPPEGGIGVKKTHAIKKGGGGGGGDKAAGWETKKRKHRAYKTAEVAALQGGSSKGFANVLAGVAYKNA